MPDYLEFLPRNHPVHGINGTLLRRLRETQESLLEKHFASAADICEAACNQAGVDRRICEPLQREPLRPFADKSHRELVELLGLLAGDQGVAPENAARLALIVADRIQLLRAFADPDTVIDFVRGKVQEKMRDFPTNAANLEQGRNPGDLLDPFLIAATQELLYGGDGRGAIEATASHKALMIIEDLVGHLHEDVLGFMRGNLRAPEPRGRAQRDLDIRENPFPGADLVQVPTARGDRLKCHQVKSKTGSAKGGDGARLGRQLQLLADTYQADVYFDALIGRSLKGHRSMAGVLGESPNAIVLVGEAAFAQLTGSPLGAELLLRVYRSAFQRVAADSPYDIRAMAQSIAAEFEARAVGDDFLQVLLADVTSGARADQDSRTYIGRRGGRRAAIEDIAAGPAAD